MEMLFFPDNPGLSAEIEEWWAQNYPLGKQLGYPDCCIMAFCNQPPSLLKGKATDDDVLRYAMGCYDGSFTGFIPCIDHARMIQSGEISIFDLIQNRNPYFGTFPDFGRE